MIEIFRALSTRKLVLVLTFVRQTLLPCFKRALKTLKGVK